MPPGSGQRPEHEHGPGQRPEHEHDPGTGAAASRPEQERGPGAGAAVSRACPEHERDPGACAAVSRDPGASPERTRLAWRRTGLSAAVAALLAVRPAFAPSAGPAEWLAAAAAMIGWAAMVTLALHRARSLRTRFPAAVPASIRAYALITAALAFLGGWVVML